VTGWRETTDEELVALQADVDGRLDALRAEGVTFQGIEDHFIITCLELLLGDRQANLAKETHLLWLKAKLADAEQQVANFKVRQKLLGGIAGTNGGHVN
jgi:hypothetical protein